MNTIYHGNLRGFSKIANTIVLEDVYALNGNTELHKKNITIKTDNTEYLPSDLKYNDLVYFVYNGCDSIIVEKVNLTKVV